MKSINVYLKFHRKLRITTINIQYYFCAEGYKHLECGIRLSSLNQMAGSWTSWLDLEPDGWILNQMVRSWTRWSDPEPDGQILNQMTGSWTRWLDPEPDDWILNQMAGSWTRWLDPQPAGWILNWWLDPELDGWIVRHLENCYSNWLSLSSMIVLFVTYFNDADEPHQTCHPGFLSSAHVQIWQTEPVPSLFHHLRYWLLHYAVYFSVSRNSMQMLVPGKS